MSAASRRSSVKIYSLRESLFDLPAAAATAAATSALPRQYWMWIDDLSGVGHEDAVAGCV